jgi:16S rRNA (guanine966-N2)-methyltransferase
MKTNQRRVRVIGGELRGRFLDYPPDGPSRPTMRRTKSSVFESLGDRVPESVFVDLYAGAGGIGIEALSRGARFCHFVEMDSGALAYLRRNLERCRVAPERYALHATDAMAFLKRGGLAGVEPDIVYADPPYGAGDLGLLLELLGGIVYPPTAKIIIEHPTGTALDAPQGLAPAKSRSFGQTSVTVFGPRV